MGYGVIALNYEWETHEGPIPDPSKIEPLPLPDSSHQVYRASQSLHVPVQPPIQQLKRITFHLEDMKSMYIFSGAQKRQIEQYDLVAVVPESQQVFQHLCEHAEDLPLDLISINVCAKISFSLSPHLLKRAISKGIRFEISYVPALQDTTSRRYFVANGLNLTALTKGKHICLTSKSPRMILLRAPYHVINVGLVLGMSSRDRAKDAITGTCRHVVERAKARRKNQLTTISKLDSNDIVVSKRKRDEESES